MSTIIELNESPLVIAYRDNTGFLVPIQELDQFLYKDKDLRILCSLHGKVLYDILYDDLGVINYQDNKITLSTILQIDTNRSLMNIMGRVGESVLVRRCNQYKNLNLMWMKYASGRNTHAGTAEEFRAIGTGFKSTQRYFPTVYDPNNTQRDIIWLNEKTGLHYQRIGSNGTAGLDAGLQVKVSSNGLKYVYDDVIKRLYEVPIVYFDLHNDYWEIFRRVEKKLKDEGKYNGDLTQWFIRAKDVDDYAYEEVEEYSMIVKAMLKGKISPEDLIERGERYPTLGTSILAGALDPITNNTIIEGSHDWDNNVPDIEYANIDTI